MLIYRPRFAKQRGRAVSFSVLFFSVQRFVFNCVLVKSVSYGIVHDIITLCYGVSFTPTIVYDAIVYSVAGFGSKNTRTNVCYNLIFFIINYAGLFISSLEHCPLNKTQRFRRLS